MVDRVVIRPDQNRRLTDAVEIASALSGGLVLADIPEEKREILFSQNYACDDCGASDRGAHAAMFPFNSPHGAPDLWRSGTRLCASTWRLIDLTRRSSSSTAASPRAAGTASKMRASAGCITTHSKKNITSDLATPIGGMPEHARDPALPWGGRVTLALAMIQSWSPGVPRRPFEGIVCNLERRYQETQSDAMRASLEDCMAETACPTVVARLRPGVAGPWSAG